MMRGRSRPVSGILGVLAAGAAVLALGGSEHPSGAVPLVTEVLPRPAPASQPVVALRPVGYWERRFLESWDFDRENGLPASKVPDSWRHYEIAYDVDANTAMFRATGQARYLDRALAYVSNVTATARVSSSLLTSQYLGWVSFRDDLDPPGVEVPCTKATSGGTRPPCCG